MTDPTLVELARVGAGLTQGQLARELGKSQPFISQVERGERDIPSDLLPAWADACAVPVSYFGRTERPLGDALAGMIHRRMKTLPAKPFHLANAQMKLTALHLDALFAEVDVVPSLTIPDLPRDIGPADAAEVLRRTWLVPQGPLPDLVGLVESAGIPVVLLDTFHQKQSATSHRGRWYEWMIGLNQNHPASRRRFTLAHELGHIVLGHDSHAAADDGEAARFERDADAFAASLLLPAADAVRELRTPTFSRLVALKQRWRVSIAFLIRHALDNALIDTSRRTLLEMELSAQPGGRRREPAEFDAEQPTLVHRLIDALLAERLTLTDIAELMTTTEATVRTRYLGERPRLHPVENKPTRTVLHLPRPPG
jgi:Zn-dependent peptidase ImmA (M78 family)